MAKRRKDLLWKKEWMFISFLCLVYFLFFMYLWEYRGDDTYIPLVYARNLANGYGFSFNPGEPSYGFTSPLWVIMLSLFYFFSFVDLLLVAKLLSLVFSILSIPLIYLLTKNLTRNRKIALLVAIFWTLEPWFIRWGAFGIETSFFTFLVLCGLLFLQRDERIAAIFLGLAFLTRPEAFLFLPLLIIKGKGKKILPSLIFLIIALPWLFYSQLTFGTVFPNSLYPKGGLNIASPSLLLDEFFIYFISLFVLLPFLPFSLAHFLKKDFDNHFLPIFWFFAVALYYFISASTSSRYVLPLIPIALIYSFSGLEKFCKNKEVFNLLLICFICEIIFMDAFVLTFYSRVGNEFLNVHYYTAEWIRNNRERLKSGGKQ